jgi:soluble lytic murein transglycosylase
MFRLIVLCLFIFLFFQANASESSPLRKTFERAEKQLWKTNSSAYKALYNQLHFYPLQPYIDQRRLIHKMRLSSANEINAFLEKYRGTPLDWPLRKKWLNYLIKRNRQTLFLAFYKPSSSVEFTCRYYQYQLNKGMAEAPILAKISSSRTCAITYQSALAM